MSGYAQAVIAPMGDLADGREIIDKPFTEAGAARAPAGAQSRSSLRIWWVIVSASDGRGR